MSWEPPPDTKCCDTWEQSKEAGTDNELYGAVTMHFDGEWCVGLNLPPVKFCPWCGSHKNIHTEPMNKDLEYPTKEDLRDNEDDRLFHEWRDDGCPPWE